MLNRFKARNNISNHLSKSFFTPIPKRHITIETYHFVSTNGSKVTDYRLSSGNINTKSDISEKILELLKEKNAICILTQPSRFLRKQGTGYVLANINRIEDIISLKKAKNKLMPDPGHICAAITNHEGEIVADLSFRPDKQTKPILEAEMALHPDLYDTRVNQIRRSLFASFLTEITQASNLITFGPNLILYISVITGTQINHKLSNLCDTFEKIKDKNSAFYMAVYNLCTSYIKQSSLEKIQDPILLSEINHLIDEAEKLPFLSNFEPIGRRRIAAQACGHALAKAFLQDTHALERTIGADLTTQQYTAHIIATLIADNKYLHTTHLLDDAADIIGKIATNKPKLGF